MSCERLGGDPDTNTPDYVRAAIDSSPYLRLEDAAHFAKGLRLAGLSNDASTDHAQKCP